MTRRIYLDHHATTPCDARVFEAMRPYFTEKFGNAASKLHDFGREAEEALEEARAEVARGIGAKSPDEIVFTSGATESLNLALKGLAALHPEKRHVVTQATEHKAVLDPVKRLAMRGADVTILPVDREGAVAPEAVRRAIRPDTLLVAVMAANNEIGTLQPVGEIGQVCREKGVWFLTDATQAVGKIPFDVASSFVDLAAMSAHKFYGPKGIGALYIRKVPGLRLEPLLDGGGHEAGLRSGTVNVPGAVGLACALSIALAGREDEAARLASLRARLYQVITNEIDGVRLNGPPLDSPRRLPGNLHLGFEHCEGESLLLSLEGIALSTGSACTTAKQEASHVVTAIGLTKEEGRGTLRFGLGRGNTEEEIDEAGDRVIAAVRRLRRLSPFA